MVLQLFCHGCHVVSTMAPWLHDAEHRCDVRAMDLLKHLAIPQSSPYNDNMGRMFTTPKWVVRMTSSCTHRISAALCSLIHPMYSYGLALKI